MQRTLTFVLATWLLSMGFANAQDAVQPTEEHKFLAESVGEWAVKIEMPQGDMDGVAKYKMAHGGLWLTSELEMDMPQGKFTGQGLDTYDVAKKKFVGVWVDSMTTSPLVVEGTLSADRKTLTMQGKGPGSDGQPTDYKMVTTYKDKDTHVFQMWVGTSSGEPMMTATYTRKK